jgi:hypothetical protein
MYRQQKSIAILTCWYGPYPWYFPYFICSCAYNPKIDFYIITDNRETIPNKPENVKIKNIALDEIKKTASAKLGFTVNNGRPYKLCDIKPAYGFLFPEIIKGYSFWGYGDVDVMYGDLRHFLTNKLLEEYDIFSFRPEYLTGALTIFRNVKKMNQLFMQSSDYKTVFSQSEYFNFDECNFLFVPLWDGKSIDTLPCQVESMTHVIRRKAKANNLKAYFDFNLIEGTVGSVRWYNGRIFYKNQFEAILYHLLKFKDCCKQKFRKVNFKENVSICFSSTTIYKRNTQ